MTRLPQAMKRTVVFLLFAIALAGCTSPSGTSGVRVSGTVENMMSDDAYAYPEAWAEEDFMENAKSDQPRENKYSCAPTYQETAADVVLWSDEWYMQGGASMEDDCKILEPTMDDEMTLEFSWSTQSIDQDPGGDTVQDYTSKSVAIEGVSQLEVRYRIDSGGQVSIEVVDRS